MTDKRVVSVFATADLKGTTAVVYWQSDEQTSEKMQLMAEEESAPATCFYKQVSETNFDVRFFNVTHEIQLCGHGLLATAKVIVDKGCKDFTLNTRQGAVRAKYNVSNDRVWIAFDELRSYSTNIPKWASDCFNVPPVSACKAGPDDGYWVMEWPQSFDGKPFHIEGLVVDHQCLLEKTKRAVIATQLSEVPDYDYYFRYFAPQHGVMEDKATGSAHRVLISYWHQRLNQRNFKARQYSKGGAELKGRIENGDIWISGNVFIER